MESSYRPCVLAVCTNDSGEVLVGERIEPAGSWQFPQGGIDPGESPEAAVRREVLEEIGVDKFTIVSRSQGFIRYHFPPELRGPLTSKYKGQDQIWFHLHLASVEEPSLERASDKEFSSLAWVSVAEALKRVVPFKRQAYEQGLAELNLLRNISK